MKKVMVFGVFDGLHEGHKKFFEEARTHGDRLVAVVAQDVIVEQLKGKRPARDMGKRFADLETLDGVDEVVIGDAEQGAYEVVLKQRPDTIALGYDQEALRENLEAWIKKEFDPSTRLGASWKPRIVVMQAFEPNKYKSSMLNSRE